MNTAAELRVAADNCRRLSQSMKSPDDAQKLLTLATEFDDLAHAVEAAEGTAAEAQRNG